MAQPMIAGARRRRYALPTDYGRMVSRSAQGSCVGGVSAEVGACEAKTKFPELLRQVQAGKHFTIIHRGKAIADLIPSRLSRSKNAAAAIDRFLAFKKAHPVRASVAIKSLIEAGRE